MKYNRRFYDIKPKIDNHERNMGIVLVILVALTLIGIAIH